MKVVQIDLRVRPLHPGQRRVVERAGTRGNILRCGRRWGKTALLGRLTIEAFLRGQRVGWFAPTYAHQEEVWRWLERRLAPMAHLISMRESPHPRIAEGGGGLIEIWSLASGDAVARGRSYHLVVVDEAAFAPDLEAQWDYAIGPTLLDTGGVAWIASTPRGRNGFFRLWARYEGVPGWGLHHAPSHENPFLNRDWLEEYRRTRPAEAYRQEILAEWADVEGRVFAEDAIARSVALSGPTAPQEGGRYAAGVDLAQAQDYTAVVVLELGPPHRLVHADRWRGLSYTLTARKVVEVLERYRAWAAVDATGVGRPVLEDIRAVWPLARGLTITSGRGRKEGSIGKEDLVSELVVHLERGALELYPYPELMEELRSFEAVPLPGGGFRYSAPSGGHDDLVMALALAVEASRWAPTGPGYRVRGRW